MAAGYQVGQQVRLTGTFRNAEGVLADPTTVTLKVQTAAGISTTYTLAKGEVTRDSVGVYHRDIEITKPATGGGGTWTYRYEGAGAVIAANETTFPVEQTAF